MNVRDASVLLHIVQYCDQISEAVARFGDDPSVFLSDKVYQQVIPWRPPVSFSPAATA